MTGQRMEYIARCRYCQGITEIMEDDPLFPTITAESLIEWEQKRYIIEHVPRIPAVITATKFCNCVRPKGNQLPLPGFGGFDE